MSDKGSELHVSRGLMERYRQAKDGDRPMVLKSPTGTPILLVEAMNAQYQRRMQTFRTSGLTNDPAAVLRDISDQLNNQPRPSRGNLSPVQLLALSEAQRRLLNDKFAAPAGRAARAEADLGRLPGPGADHDPEGAGRRRQGEGLRAQVVHGDLHRAEETSSTRFCTLPILSE